MRQLPIPLQRLATFGGCAMLALSAHAATSTATRPQLTDAEAANHTIAKYMAQAGTIGSLTTDNWDPTGGVGAVSNFKADYAVASDGSTTYKSIGAAIQAAVANGGGSVRKYISVKAGTYTEVVCIPASAPPITLYGLDATSGNTVIVFNNANPTPQTVHAPNPCTGNSTAATVGTMGSATVAVLAQNFQARNLTFKNSYVEGTYTDANQSAVALALRGDKAILENVSIIGNQDTLYVGSGNSTTVMRAYIKSSFIQGDTDFIFGPGTAVFHGATIQSTGARIGATGSGYVFAPSTQPGNTHGFLAINSTFNSAGGTSANTTYLGRAWDQGVASASAYVNGTSPNGAVVVRDSAQCPHIRSTAPWGTSTSGRPYCSSGCATSANRFFEYNNNTTCN
ncbi:MAG TPA: putative acyl-CoA thioester hydrolase [Duganella sp.]|uniref:putative acyl-CoA thioester hydrolase n=1 Tax=Duganella sp. TaxID=1904440 RepID=UPI002ED1933A